MADNEEYLSSGAQEDMSSLSSEAGKAQATYQNARHGVEKARAAKQYAKEKLNKKNKPKAPVTKKKAKKGLKDGVKAIGTLLGRVFFIIKCVLIILVSLAFLIGLVSLCHSSAVINQVSHVNNADTLASNIEEGGGEYDYRYYGTADEDLELIKKTYEDGKAKIDSVLTDSLLDVNKLISADITKRQLEFQKEHGETLFVRRTIHHTENKPITDDEAILVTAAYSASMDNLLSEEADNYLTGKNDQISKSQIVDMKNKLDTLRFLEPDPSVTPREGYTLFGNYFTCADVKMEYVDETVTVGLVSYVVHYLDVDEIYNPVNYNSATEKAFSYSPLEPYGDNAVGLTYIDYIYELAAATSEELGLVTTFGADQGLFQYNALILGRGDGSIVDRALAYAGVGGSGVRTNGSQFWRWYGFNTYVYWCACFVSYVANECGYINAGIIPKFSSCRQGVAWFQARNQYQSARGYQPKSGDIVFFDWKHDGVPDHVGIVTGSDSEYVYTIEGNTTNGKTAGTGVFARKRSYNTILGYGIPRYDLVANE